LHARAGVRRVCILPSIDEAAQNSPLRLDFVSEKRGSKTERGASEVRGRIGSARGTGAAARVSGTGLGVVTLWWWPPVCLVPLLPQCFTICQHGLSPWPQRPSRGPQEKTSDLFTRPKRGLVQAPSAAGATPSGYRSSHPTHQTHRHPRARRLVRWWWGLRFVGGGVV
jgi:hypothetical protein